MDGKKVIGFCLFVFWREVGPQALKKVVTKFFKSGRGGELHTHVSNQKQKNQQVFSLFGTIESEIQKANLS